MYLVSQYSVKLLPGGRLAEEYSSLCCSFKFKTNLRILMMMIQSFMSSDVG